MSRGEAIDADSVRAALRGQLIGSRLVSLDEATSTNDVLAQLASQSGEGLVVLAERQTAGRGQYGRRWESAAGKGLWLSVLLRPQIPVSHSSQLTDLLAETIATTIRQTLGTAASIKPPNDVYIETRKVAGVLVEMRVESDGGYCAIAGAGVNVNHTGEDFPAELGDRAGSLAMATGSCVDRSRFLIALLRTLELRYSAFRQGARVQR